MRFLASLVALTLATPLVAQNAAASRAAADPDKKVSQGKAATPPGWSMRLDRANAKATDVKFVSMGKGLHVTGGPAAIYWTKQPAAGNFTLGASFTQMKPATHPEAYGLVFNGAKLDGAEQSYYYFLVRQDGKFMINHRAGADVHKIVEWTDHAAVQKVPAGGKATNKLEVNVAADAVNFLVNGQTVRSIPRTQIQTADGLVGIRVNHNLDVHVEGFAVTK